MYTLLPKIFNMSITASIVIVFVIIARLLLKKSPKIFSYTLWLIVLFRLICPVSISVPTSVLNGFDTDVSQSGAMEFIPPNIVHEEYPEVKLPIGVIENVINDNLASGEEQLVADPLEAPVALLTLVWVSGVGVMLSYSLISLIILKNRLKGSINLDKNIYSSKKVDSPFVLGILKPRIYIPENINKNDYEHIILHEETHIKRFDHIVKIIFFIAVIVHFFNPLVWISYFLMTRDMEMSCDESVIKKSGSKKEYSTALLSFSTTRKNNTPLAFFEGDTTKRIKNILNYKKPKFWVGFAGILVVIIAVFTLSFNATTPTDIKNTREIIIERQEKIEVLDFEKDEVIGINADTFSKFLKENKFQKMLVDSPYELIPNYKISNISGDEIRHEIRVYSSNLMMVMYDEKYTYYKISDEVFEEFEMMLKLSSNMIPMYNFEKLCELKTNTLKDTEKVEQIINLLPYQADVEFESFSNQEEPNTIAMTYKTKYYKGIEQGSKHNSDIFLENSILMYALIDDLENIIFTIKDVNSESSYQNSRESLGIGTNNTLNKYKNTPQNLAKLLNTYYEGTEALLDIKLEPISTKDFNGSEMYYEYSLSNGKKEVKITTKNVTNPTYEAEAILFDENKYIATIFTLGTGTGVSVTEVHVFDAATLENIYVASAQEILDSISKNYSDEEYFYLDIGDVESKIPTRKEIRPEIGDSISFGNIVRFGIQNDQLTLRMAGYSGIGIYPCDIIVEYGFKDQKFIPESIFIDVPYSNSLTTKEVLETQEIAVNYFTNEAPFYEGVSSIDFFYDSSNLYKNSGIEGEYSKGNIIIYKVFTNKDKENQGFYRTISIARKDKNSIWEIINTGKMGS